MMAYALPFFFFFFEAKPTILLCIPRRSLKPSSKAASLMMSFLISAGSILQALAPLCLYLLTTHLIFLLSVMCEHSFSYKLFKSFLWNMNHLQGSLEFLNIFFRTSWLH